MPTIQASHLPTLLRSPTHPILLRTLEPRDAAVISAVLSDPENTKYDPHASAVSPEVAAGVISRMRESAAAPTVLDEASGRVVSGPGRVNLLLVYVGGDDEGVGIGLAGFGGIDEREREGGGKLRVGDVGAMVNPAYRGRGFATEAVRLAVEWGFTRVEDGGPQFDRITATMLEANEPMVGLMERKFGWERVARPGKEGEVTFEVGPEDWRK
ncbi:acetyltransferase [Colletotrichum graminicola]|uniref:Acetyltransferase n=1 Tax=Colletotrichum graminicola (strain M1.001 / M2 / FGSC 10212) TaxID=645133 RepID=E3QJB5_COLGM|nr:acetyltransferase [Colletotrichum graminicola M1.001]EFQ30953.1 acetyltransferase [Colletotrichum graminicola M1.001]WDK17341.1 acetyltransferase [Colletotrichum graminicola]